MGRPSAMAFSTLTGQNEIVTRWERGQRGPDDRYQMRHYAIQVAIAMGSAYVNDTLTCIHCGLDFHVPSLGDTDRIVPSRGYVPGNVVMVCRMCNETRGFMQQGNSDLGGIARLTADVLAASANVHVPTKRDAKAARSNWVGIIRQRVGGTHWIVTLSRSPYWHA